MFRIHTKGLGLVCVDPKGIPAHQEIGEYLGEIYPLWYWYEKQKQVKSYISL